MKKLSLETSIIGEETDALRIYFREIKRYPQLTAEQEIALGERIRKGDQQALHELVQSNLRIVVSVAKMYGAQGMELLDLVSEGNYGLVMAARHFDPSLGLRFATYAVTWIQRSILRAVETASGLIRTPRRQKCVVPPLVSLDVPAGEKECALSDCMSADDVHCYDVEVVDDSLDDLREALRTLSPLERRVIVENFGLDGCEPRRISDMNAGMGRSRDSLLEVRRTALSKLRRMLR